ncbi:hypothetical protein [Mesomycoplasma lagogenitalium]|uniref:ABC transporter ATP-binding protein n=1 Tax=Mesomycoplasma lagogenitalium TaxID=171286 RepID=A0ABY8LXB7_9BACT|nr:hypothetical protein [Mesomycoplasma lagogenitalium]WGI36777.1 hypothetical protein QEG99_00605 [Mesomycoplasma lagogenitalium]
MEKEMNILSLIDVSFKDKLRNVNLEIKRGESIIIFSSDSSLPYSFRDLLVFKNKKYSGVIKIGNSFLKRKSSDFFVNEKVLSIFSDNRKNHYFDKPLFEVMKYSLETNEHNFKLIQDFRKDWKEISEEYEFYIKENEEKFTSSLFLKQIKIYDEFLNSIDEKEIFTQKGKKIDFQILNNYLDKRIAMLNKSLSTISYYEVKKYNSYLDFQRKYRNHEGKLQNLKTDYKKVEKEVFNFANTSEFNIENDKKGKILFDINAEIKKELDFLKYGNFSNGFYKLLIKALKLKIIRSRKELKLARKTKKIDDINKAKINYWVKTETYKLFKKNRKHFKYIDDKNLKGLYKTIQDFEISYYNEVFFDFKRGKKIHWNESLKKIDSSKEKRYSLRRIKEMNQMKIEETKEKINNLYRELEKNKKIKVLGSKEIDKSAKNIKENDLLEKKADYFWEINQSNSSLTDSITINVQNNKKLEQQIIKRVLQSMKIDRHLFSLLQKNKQKLNKIPAEIKKKIEEVKNLDFHAFEIYHPLSFVYTKDFDENSLIQKVIIKNELFAFLESINMNSDKLWIPYSQLSLKDRIKIDIAKLKLYSPDVVIVDLRRTIFDHSYIDEMIKYKDEKTTLLIFSDKYFKSSVNNYIFIEKGKIIEQALNNRNLIFETEYAKKFMEDKKFHLEILEKISLMDYEEIYNSRKSYKINNSLVYTSENDVAMLKLIDESKENQDEFVLEKNDVLDIEDTVIIDLSSKSKEK